MEQLHAGYCSQTLAVCQAPLTALQHSRTPCCPAFLFADEAEATKPTQQQSGLEADFADGFKRE
jgi:hypothetical protein